MCVPHLLNKFVGKRCSTCQQFIHADSEGILVGVASWITLPLFRWHVGCSACDFTQRRMSLHPKIECRAEISKQDLPIASNEQIAGFDVLVNKAMLMNIVEDGCRLLDIWHKLFCIRKAPAAIYFTKEVMDSFWRVLHHQVGTSILNLTKVIDRKDVGVLQMSNALCFVKEAVLPFFVELLGTQNFECQYATEWRRFAYLVNVAVGACANQGDYFVDTDMRSFDQKVASFTGFCFRGIFMSPACSRIQTTGQ